jgi:hypothetical protein
MAEKFSEATDENMQIIQKYADNKIASYFSDLHKEIAQFQMSPLSGQERTAYEVTFAKLNSSKTTFTLTNRNSNPYTTDALMVSIGINILPLSNEIKPKLS